MALLPSQSDLRRHDKVRKCAGDSPLPLSSPLWAGTPDLIRGPVPLGNLIARWQLDAGLRRHDDVKELAAHGRFWLQPSCTSGSTLLKSRSTSLLRSGRAIIGRMFCLCSHRRSWKLWWQHRRRRTTATVVNEPKRAQEIVELAARIHPTFLP